jgi:hypothetical protein
MNYRVSKPVKVENTYTYEPRRFLDITYRSENETMSTMTESEFKYYLEKQRFKEGIWIYAIVVCILLLVLFAMISLRIKRKI